MRRYRSPSGSIEVTGISGFSIVLGCADVDFVSGVAFVSPMVEVNLAFSRDMSTIRDGSSQCKQERKDIHMRRLVVRHGWWASGLI
jgi:hypothetical protein